MITEKLINLFEAHTVNQKEHREELKQYRGGDIHMDHNKKSVRLLTHKDLDGIVSAVLLVHKFESQGIPKDRIVINFGQYGDKPEEILKGTERKNNHEFTAGTDFSALPSIDMWDSFNKLMSFKADPARVCSFINATDWSKKSKQTFLFNIKKFKYEQTEFTQKNLDDLYRAIRVYSANKSDTADDWRKTFTVQNIKNHARVPLVITDFMSDHHDNSAKRLVAGAQGEIGVQSASNAGLIARKYCPGVMDEKDIEAVNMADSAGYTKEELENSVFLEKHFSGKDRKRNLATIMATMADQLCKKNPEAAVNVIKSSNPNLVSIYNNMLKALDYNEKEIQLYNALSQNDISKAKTIADSLPKNMSKNWTDKEKYSKIQHINTREEWQKKNKEDLDIAKTGYPDKEKLENLKNAKKALGRKNSPEKDDINSKIEAEKSKKGRCYVKGDFMVQDDSSTKGYPTRYQPSLMSVNGKRKPYTIKVFGSMVQCAANPLYHGPIDFGKVFEAVRPEFKNWLEEKVGSFRAASIMKEVEYESGGHKGIMTFQGFDKIQPTSKEGKSDYWKYRKILDRAKKIPGFDAEAKMPNISKKYNDLNNGVMADYEKLRSEAKSFVVDKIIEKTEKLFPVDETKFEGNADSKWDIKQ